MVGLEGRHLGRMPGAAPGGIKMAVAAAASVPSSFTSTYARWMMAEMNTPGSPVMPPKLAARGTREPRIFWETQIQNPMDFTNEPFLSFFQMERGRCRSNCTASLIVWNFRDI